MAISICAPTFCPLNAFVNTSGVPGSPTRRVAFGPAEVASCLASTPENEENAASSHALSPMAAPVPSLSTRETGSFTRKGLVGRVRVADEAESLPGATVILSNSPLADAVAVPGEVTPGPEGASAHPASRAAGRTARLRRRSGTERTETTFFANGLTAQPNPGLTGRPIR